VWPALFHPPIELSGLRPCSHLHGDWAIDHAAVRFTVLARIEIHIQLEHVHDSGFQPWPVPTDWQKSAEF
jgi:hypothetical protein